MICITEPFSPCKPSLCSPKLSPQVSVSGSSRWLEMKSTQLCVWAVPPAVLSVHHNFLHVAFTRAHHVHTTAVPSPKQQQPPHPFMSTSPPCSSATNALLLFGSLLLPPLSSYSPRLSLCLYIRVHFSVMLLRLCQSWMSQAVTVCHGWCAVSEIISEDTKWIGAGSWAMSHCLSLCIYLVYIVLVTDLEGKTVCHNIFPVNIRPIIHNMTEPAGR